MSREGAARRNRAQRKIISSKYLTSEIKDAIQTIFILLNPKSDYMVAWPSSKTIASRMGRSRRSGLMYVRIIKALDIFRVQSLTPEKAVAYCERNFGIRPKLERCGGQAPNLFVVNESHPLWNSQRALPEDVDRKMGQIARQIKAKRNAKTTSRLASDPVHHPKRHRYSLHKMRESLHRTLELLRDDIANEGWEYDQEELQWCREESFNDVVRDIIHSVVRDNQGFKRFSCEVDFVSSPPEARLEKAAAATLSVISSLQGSAVRQPCKRSPLAKNIPPARQFCCNETREGKRLIEYRNRLTSFLEKQEDYPNDEIIVLASEYRSAPASRTVPIRHGMPEHGVGIDGELLSTMKRQKAKRAEKERRLIAMYVNRPDASVFDSVSLAVRYPSFSSGRPQGCP
jgi:hypothetical protein